MKPKDYKPIGYRQLFVIAKTVLQRNPTIDDAEWKAKTRETLAKMGFDEPEAHTLTSAMNQVERRLLETVGPRVRRPVPEPPTPNSQLPTPSAEPPVSKVRTSNPLGWDIVQALMARLGRSPRCAPSLPTRPEPSQVLAITEEAALNEFWAQVRNGSDKLSLLRAFAEVAIVRPDDWDYLAVREHAGEHALRANGCFVCAALRTADWHHVIQIQHGGSNYLRNRVCLCESCHRDVHPWMAAIKRRTVGDWYQVGEIDVSRAVEKQTA